MSSCTRLKLCPKLHGRGAGERGFVLSGQRLVGEEPKERADALAPWPGGQVEAQVIGEHLVQWTRVAVVLREHRPHLVLDLTKEVGKLGPDVHR